MRKLGDDDGATTRRILRGWSGAVALVALLLTGCATAPPAAPPAPTPEPAEPAPMEAPMEVAQEEVAAEEPPSPASVVVAETWETVRRPEENVDSVAVWPGAGDRAWLLATAKATDRLLVFDAGTGELLREFGGHGDAAGRFRRPNGIAVVHDLAFVVERDNARVQVLRLPGLSTVGFLGEGELEYPYGISVVPTGTGTYDVYVSDNHPPPPAGVGDDELPPPEDLTRRVHRYRVRVIGDDLTAEPPFLFGAASGPGALHAVETLMADPGAGRLLVADEEKTRMGLRDHDLESGTFTGRVVEGFTAEPEGLALYPCPDGDGYWIATDQHEARTRFLVLDRRTLDLVGRFTGELTANTDGVWLSTVPIPAFPAGAFYAVHDDRSVTAFDWRDVATALDLRADCATEGK